MIAENYSIFKTNKLELVSSHGFIDSDNTILLNNNNTLSVHSGINALICLRFKIYAEDESKLEINLGQQILFDSAIVGMRNINLYLVVSPGNNVLNFKFNGKKSFGNFTTFTDSEIVFDFAIISPTLEILAH